MFELVKEVRKYMEESFADYYAEQYDERYDYEKYNKTCRAIYNAKENGYANHIDEELDTDDFSVVCALFRAGIWK